MTLNQETKTEILRLYHADGLSKHAIGCHLQIHHKTVDRVILSQSSINPSAKMRTSVVDPYVPLILKKMEEFQKITSTRLFQMLKDHGYEGSFKAFKKKLRILKLDYPRTNRAYLPLSTYAGEEAQVDWAHFGTLQIGKAKRKLSCFVMVLSHSRAMFATFTFDQGMSSFLSSHIKAFHHFGGVPRKLRYDNLKTAVVTRHGSSIHYNDDLLNFSGHYHFQPSACNPYSGHEKGKVERSIRYIRDNFFLGRSFSNLDDANRQINVWLDTVSNQRSWPQDRDFKVCKVWENEKKSLLPLPLDIAATHKLQPVCTKKYPYIHFDLNDYSIPSNLVNKKLSLKAELEEIIIYDKDKEVSRHKRSYDKGVRSTHEDHLKFIKEQNPGAYTVAIRDKLIQLIPELDIFYKKMIEYRMPLGKATGSINNLINTYGLKTVEATVKEALEKNIIKTSYLYQICKNKEVKNSYDLSLDLSKNPKISEISVQKHNLSQYDEI